MVSINFAKEEHLSLISEFEKNNFSAETYSYDVLSEMLKDNYLLKDNDNIFVALNENELIGYIIFHISADFTDIYKIYIREGDRHKGYASSLINKVVDISNRYSVKKIMIEVRSKNETAIDFYKKCGFESISVRKDYYKNPKDDAMIFERRL